MLSKPAGFKSKTSVGFTGSVFEIFCRFNFYWKKYPQKNHSHFRKVEDIASAFRNENLSIDTNPKTILIREQLKIILQVSIIWIHSLFSTKQLSIPFSSVAISLLWKHTEISIPEMSLEFVAFHDQSTKDDTWKTSVFYSYQAIDHDSCWSCMENEQKRFPNDT